MELPCVMVLLGMPLAAEQVITERPGGRMGFWDTEKWHARQKGILSRKCNRNYRGDLNKWLVAHIIPHQNSNGIRVIQSLAEHVRWQQENERVFYSLIQLNKHGDKSVTTVSRSSWVTLQVPLTFRINRAYISGKRQSDFRIII